MDEYPGILQSPKAPLQMSLFASAGFDSYVADGPPVMAQKTMGFVIAPLARMMGYRSYYQRYD